MLKNEVATTHMNLNPQLTRSSVVVIDDSEDLLYLVETILEIDHYEIFTAQSGAKAFQLLAEIKQPDLILLDMQMQDMTGPDFLILLEEKMPDLIKAVPVVFLTGMDQVPKCKAVGFLRKPIYDIDKFRENIRRFIFAGAEQFLNSSLPISQNESNSKSQNV
jgi:CheY-like chemotaxis protein